MTIYNSCINLPKPTSTNYKIYNELTEADLITWIESLISTKEITLMQTVINLNTQDIKTRSSSLPWTLIIFFNKYIYYIY